MIDTKRYYGARNANGSFWAIGTHPLYVKGHGVPSDEILQLDVTLHPDQSIPDSSARGIDYFGWVDEEGEHFVMIQPSYIQFAIQFTYGWKAAVEHGKGMIYRLKVTQKELT